MHYMYVKLIHIMCVFFIQNYVLSMILTRRRRALGALRKHFDGPTKLLHIVTISYPIRIYLQFFIRVQRRCSAVSTHIQHAAESLQLLLFMLLHSIV